MTCGSCGGVIGLDCFNPEECELITQSMNDAARQSEHELHYLRRSMATVIDERDDARQAARWMLPFLVNEPQHIREACRRWPWLEEIVPCKPD